MKALIDRRFWTVMKERQFFNDWCVYLLKRNDFFMVVVEDEYEMPVSTYSTFDSKLANGEYNKWRRKLMDKNLDWSTKIKDGFAEEEDNG